MNQLGALKDRPRPARDLPGVTRPAGPHGVTMAADKLERLRESDRKGLAERILAIGRDCASRMSPEALALDHGEYLYDERGLPR